MHNAHLRYLAAILATTLLAGCGGGSDEEKGTAQLLEVRPGVIELLLRTNSGLPEYANAPLGSTVLASTNPSTTLTAGVPFVLIVRASPGNTFLDTAIDAHVLPDIDVAAPQDGHDRGGGNEATLKIKFDTQLGPNSHLPGTGIVPYSQLPAYNGSNERAILDRASQIGVPIEDIALPANFNLAVYLNRNVLTSTVDGLPSPDNRDPDSTVVLGWKPSGNQLPQQSATGSVVHVDASAAFFESPIGVTFADYDVAAATGGLLNLRVRSASAAASVAMAPSAAAVRGATLEIANLAAGLPYVLELEVVPGSSGFDLHTDPEWISPTQNGLDRGGGNEGSVQLTADRQLGPPANLPGVGVAPYSSLPTWNGTNERAIFDAARAVGIDPFTIALPAGFNLAIFLNRNVFTSTFGGAPSPDTRNDSVVVLSSLGAGLGAAATAALAGDTITFTGRVVDRGGVPAVDVARLGVTVPVSPGVDFTVRSESSRPNLADAPPASSVQIETVPITTVGVGSPFDLFLAVTPGSTGIDFHLDPEWMMASPPQSGLVRGGGNEAELHVTANRQLGNSATLPGAGAPPYDALPFFSGTNERVIVNAALGMGIDPTTIALPAGFNLAVFFNRNVLTSDAMGVPSTDSRNAAASFLASYQLGTAQAASAALLGDTITFDVTLEDRLGSIAMGQRAVTVRPAVPPAADLHFSTDSGLASLADAPTADLVVAASMDLAGAVAPGTAFTIFIDVMPGDGRIDAHAAPELIVQTPAQDGRTRGGGNEVTIVLFADVQLGVAANLPATGLPPYDALPAYDGTNERAIVDAAIAMGIDPTTVALPAGFNLAVLLNRNILTTDSLGVPSPDSRIPTLSFTLAYAVPMAAGFDPSLSGGAAQFTLVVTDALGNSGTDIENLAIP